MMSMSWLCVPACVDLLFGGGGAQGHFLLHWRTHAAHTHQCCAAGSCLVAGSGRSPEGAARPGPPGRRDHTQRSVLVLRVPTYKPRRLLVPGQDCGCVLAHRIENKTPVSAREMGASQTVQTAATVKRRVSPRELREDWEVPVPGDEKTVAGSSPGSAFTE